MGRGDLTDEQWAVLEPLLPKGARVGRPPVWPRRQLIDGIRFRVRTGVPWRDVPVEYGLWSRVYDLFRRWQRNGAWQRILTRLQSLADARGAIVWDLSVDSTVCRAHPHAAGARKRGDLQKEPSGGVFTEPGDHGLGRSRGGFTTKLHLAVEQGQRPMSIVIVATRRSSSPCWRGSVCPASGRAGRASAPIACARTRRTLPARTAPTCAAVVSAAPSRTRPTRRASARSVAPAVAGRPDSTPRTTRLGMPSSAASIVSKGTGLWATRYDKLAGRYEATVLVAAINEWL